MFLFNTAANADSDRSPWGDFWFNPVQTGLYGGLAVTPDTAMRLSAVYACVRVLTETFVSLPPVLYRKNGRKSRPVVDHWLYRLLCHRPNRYQNAFEWREMLQGHLVLRGNAYNLIVANSRGVITELMPVHPDKISQHVNADGSYYYVITDRAGKQTAYKRGDIWHIKGLMPDIYRGYNPIELEREVIGLGLAAQSYGNTFFQNDARPASGWIESPVFFGDKDKRTAFIESIQAAQSGAKRGKMMVLEGGMKYHPVSVNNTDAQYLETRKFNRSEIAGLFRVPAHLINDLEKATFSNIEQLDGAFAKHTMQPWCERWEASIEADLLGEDESVEVEFDFTRLLRGDAKSRSNYYHNGILDGWLTRNEARQMENLDPIEGLDEPLRPLNMMPEHEAEEMNDASEGDAEPDETPGREPGETDTEKDDATE